MSSVLVFVVIICSAVTGMSGAPQSDCSDISGILSKKNVSSSPTEIPLHGQYLTQIKLFSIMFYYVTTPHSPSIMMRSESAI
ncbi:hypothetical protein GE061_018687 [Apolygus lucorum]|uniref:Secreted protein n=1 Tax=Apolygus lucorum TaxID=248454 RepID=A0A8S9XFX5_APOLU|nr:hypothetical protein GE061_018687 [Apolygus lucorum]